MSILPVLTDTVRNNHLEIDGYNAQRIETSNCCSERCRVAFITVIRRIYSGRSTDTWGGLGWVSVKKMYENDDKTYRRKMSAK